ncbi:hypothetical protein [Novosphingobium sp. B 225]|uniref:hypothetical protein n=1 Tax=Novosphingobium sp. B 225 TaxID=1961849 RepID=UPI001124D208|nr:hypothetical protein [Novosphingobium sp. B 225]
MVDVVYLSPREPVPNVGDEGRWLVVEAVGGQFYGSGGSWKQTGEWVGYGSLAEDDVSLETALAAAGAWAEKYGVTVIWVQLNP